MPWTNVEPSNPRYTPEGLHLFTVQSEALSGRGCLTVYIPPGSETAASLPMVLLLHGVYGSELAWPFMGGAHWRAQELINRGDVRPMALIMPSDGFWGEGSGYINHPGRRCEDWIIDEVPGIARGQFSCLDGHSPAFIGGLSMGGFGALRLGAKHPRLWRGISAHSSAPWFDALSRPHRPPGDDRSSLAEEDRSALSWFRRHRDRLPPARFDCGEDDFLIQDNRAFHHTLEKEGIPHTYQEFPGAHTWDYWHEHLADSLRFFEGLLPRGA